VKHKYQICPLKLVTIIGQSFTSVPVGKFGLVLVDEIMPDSNADKTKKFKIGDSLVSIESSDINAPPKESLECLNFDSTMKVLTKFSNVNNIAVGIKRLNRRKDINVYVYGPNGKLF
jgi:hypothetical protein